MRAVRTLPTWFLALIVPAIAAIAVIVTLSATSDNSVALAPNTIEIKDFTFNPGTLQAKVGVPITVLNDDHTKHTVLADDKSFDTGDISSGGKATFTIDKPGRYTYHCNIHNYMTGVIEAK